MSNKITMEDLIETLSEIRDRFKKGRSAFSDTGIIFHYSYSPIDGGIDFHMSQEMLTDLKTMHIDMSEYVPNEHNILKKKNGGYKFKKSVKHKNTGVIKVLHDFETNSKSSFLEYLKGNVTDITVEYVKEQPDKEDHAFGIFSESFVIPKCNIAYNIVEEGMNILEMLVKSKSCSDIEYATKLMRSEQITVDGRVINNIFYKVTKGEVVDVKDIVTIKIESDFVSPYDRDE